MVAVPELANQPAGRGRGARHRRGGAPGRRGGQGHRGGAAARIGCAARCAWPRVDPRTAARDGAVRAVGDHLGPAFVNFAENPHWVAVGQRHDDGLVDHIGCVGGTLTQVGDVAGVESGVLDADVGGLALFDCVGAGNVVGKGVVVEGRSSWVSRPRSGGWLRGSQSGVFGLEVAVVGFEFTVAGSARSRRC